jgi:hypothetical protein
MKRQPPNSPDFIVLELGFFAAIQALQHQSANIDELINIWKVHTILWRERRRTTSFCRCNKQ